MEWLSSGSIFYFIDKLLLPLGSTIITLLFLLFLGKMMKDDQLDIFPNAQMMSTSDAKSYLKKLKQEKLAKEFETLIKHEMLLESDKTEFLKLRESGMGTMEVIKKIRPPKNDD